MTGAEALVRLLDLHGVEYIFGLCGDTTLPLYDALARLDHGITHILARDERAAAYMADGYARMSGRVGVCEGPSGGGATYILPGVVEANESSVPLLAITSDISVAARGRYALTELDQAALFRPLTKWNTVIDRAADLPRSLRAAFRAITGGRPGAAHVGLPYDVQTGAVDGDDIWAAPTPGRASVAPSAAAIATAAEVLTTARRPLFICGGGVLIAGAEAPLAAVAESLGAPVATTISGRGAIADDHPLALGVVGSNGGVVETRRLVDAADAIVFVGCRAGSVTTERWRHPAPGAARIAHIDIDPMVIGANYPTEAALVGDARAALEGLATAVAGVTPAPGLAAEVAAAKAEKFAAFEALAASDATPIRPERIVAQLQAALPDDAMVMLDPGTPCPYFSAYYRLRRSSRRMVSNRAHGALGYALPAAIGAKFACPEAVSVAVMGDGSFGFTAGELETAARIGVDVTFVVIANGCFGWIKAGQKTGYGGRYFSVDFTATDHAAVAAAYGVRSWRVTAPEDLRPALAAAIAHRGPALVDIVAQPLQEARAPVSEWIA